MRIVTRNRLVITLLGVLLIAFGGFYYVFDPARYALMPKCMIKELTGFQCPSCGVQRAFHALLHGHILEALSYNWFFILAVPFLLLVTVTVLLARGDNPSPVILRLYYLLTGRTAMMTYVAVYIAWWIIRNIIGC